MWKSLLLEKVVAKSRTMWKSLLLEKNGGKMKCKLCGHKFSSGAHQRADPEDQWPWCGALNFEESKLNPAAAVFKKVEQQS